MNEPQKSLNIIISDEIELLENSLINIIQNSKLPFSVIKVVLKSTTNNIMAMIDNAIETEKNKYYSELSEYQSKQADTNESEK